MYYDTFHRGLTFTLSGVYTLGLILFVGLIAITTGINGLYVFLSCGLGGYVISGVLSERAIRNIHIGSVGALSLDADEPCRIFFTIENKSRSFTIFGIETLFFTTTPRYRLIAGPRHPLARHRLTVLGPKSSHVMPAICPGIPRGYYKQLKVMNLTTFPLGILEKYKISKINTHIIVSPKIDQEWLQILQKVLSQAIRALDLGAEFYMHLPYRKENAHLLDWRKNAGKKSDQWVIKHLKSDIKKIQVIIDIVREDLKGSSTEESYEAYLSRTRTAVEAGRTLGLDVMLRINQTICIQSQETILLFLARVPPFLQRLTLHLDPSPGFVGEFHQNTLAIKNSVTLHITKEGIQGPVSTT